MVQEAIHQAEECKAAGGQLRLVALSVKPLREHTASNASFDTGHLIKAYTVAFGASKVNPADRLAFIDILLLDGAPLYVPLYVPRVVLDDHRSDKNKLEMAGSTLHQNSKPSGDAAADYL